MDYTKYKWVFEEPDNWFDYYSQNFSGTWEKYFHLGKDTGLYNSGSIHFALKDIILNNYLEEINNYEYIIYTRFDQFYLSNHPKLKGDNIWIPKGEDFFGLCDRHAVIPVKYIEKFLGICKYIDQEQSLIQNANHLNCEVSFKNHLDNIGILNKVKRFDRNQFTTAVNSDTTNCTQFEGCQTLLCTSLSASLKFVCSSLFCWLLLFFVCFCWFSFVFNRFPI